MEMKGLFTTLLTALAISTVDAQPSTGVPKLVVGVTIDQLRQDYMEIFSPLYGDKGFRRLFREGRYYTNADYDYQDPDRASSIASLYSGTVPMIHGIVGESWIDPGSMMRRNCVEDPNFMGNYTNETTSAEHLQTSTLTDELKVATNGKAWVYAVAPYREAAVLAAGHAADGGFWLDETNGMWCGSTYYTTFPFFISSYNLKDGLEQRKNTLVWTPLRPAPDYKYLPFAYSQDRFDYRFTDHSYYSYKKLKTSPLINSEINRLLERVFSESEIGRDDIPDFLSVTYYAGPYDHQPVRDVAMELQDTYARLDQSLGDLLEMIDKSVGLQHTLIFVTSTGYTDPEPQDLQRFRIPTGEFHMDRCRALLNIYLNAIYGQGLWVEDYDGVQLYLNHKFIEEKQLPLTDILQKSCEFLIQMSGVREVYSSAGLLQAAWVPQVRKIRNAYHRTRSGDLVVDIMPGWTLIDAKNSENNHIVRKAYVPQPLFFMGNGIQPEIVQSPVTMDCVAPTVSKAIRIRAPNGCTSAPLF